MLFTRRLLLPPPGRPRLSAPEPTTNTAAGARSGTSTARSKADGTSRWHGMVELLWRTNGRNVAILPNRPSRVSTFLGESHDQKISPARQALEFGNMETNRLDVQALEVRRPRLDFLAGIIGRSKLRCSTRASAMRRCWPVVLARLSSRIEPERTRRYGIHRALTLFA